MRIRKTAAADAPLLPAVERSAGQAFRAIPSLAWIADDWGQSVEQHLRLMESGVSWVAVEESADGVPMGFLNGAVVDGNLHIWEMSVSRDHQRKGIGRALMSTAKDHARQSGLLKLSLTTFRDVPWNQAFYESVGFVLVEGQDVTPALVKIMEDEVKDGLPAERRCAMICQL